ncbi:uroporphyrinogen-III synthase [Pullulanibacillus sp. KACC 23026]|uniref:uroporphyrinogen-III synthase n=1 Tax=Pullulanibacillus sp. KACC 23026 TaxID=3028315 RepID=UPI0023AFC311|nr:uroporphyrinogen-III synthase [Pullulanibacillus sp. KACC 23026]WEG14039.1 uroporphyrinogen-III synthase [Pullulanibacillus sp. KACC 23026]
MNKASALLGRRLLITRDGASAMAMAKVVESYGGIPYLAPVLSFKQALLGEADIHAIMEQDWLVFTSANGVRSFFDQIKERSSIGFPRIAVVGSKTAEALNQYGLKADLMPSDFTARALATAFSELPEGQKLAILKGQLAKESLEESLKEQGHLVSSYIVYHTVPNYEGKSDLQRVLKEHPIDVLTLTSPSSLAFFLELSGYTVNDPFFDRVLLGCIGPETKKFALEQGFSHVIMPNQYTVKALIEAIAAYYLEGSSCQH